MLQFLKNKNKKKVSSVEDNKYTLRDNHLIYRTHQVELLTFYILENHQVVFSIGKSQFQKQKKNLTTYS